MRDWVIKEDFTLRQIVIKLPVAVVLKSSILLLLILFVGNAAALTLVHAFGIGDAWGLVTLFHFDREQNLPTLFSVQLILASSALAGTKAAAAAPATRDRTGWIAVSLILIFLAIDEFASIHERVDAALRYYIDGGLLPYAAWPIPYGLAVLLAASLLARWFLALPSRTAVLLTLAAIVYLSGAVGVELVAGDYIAQIDPDHLGVSDLKRDLYASVEETLELLGLLLLLWTLARR